MSAPTRAVLNRLDAPLEIRFYSVLDPASVSDSVTAFARRVDELLSAYQQAAGDKIKVTRFTSESNLNPNAAPADGIHAFNLDKGEACFLGLALVFKGHKESLPAPDAGVGTSLGTRSHARPSPACWTPLSPSRLRSLSPRSTPPPSRR